MSLLVRSPDAGRSPARGATRRQQQAAAGVRQSWGVWLNRGLIAGAVLIVLVGATVGWRTLRAVPVERVAITGDISHTGPAEIETLVEPLLAGGFLNASLSDMRTQLEALPWVYEASLRRRWPATLEIHIVEQLPIARWGDSAYLNHEGEVFDTQRAVDRDALPLLAGVDGSAATMMGYYQAIVEQLVGTQLDVHGVRLGARDDLHVSLDGGLQLVVAASDLEERLAAFVAVYRSALSRDQRPLARVDLRYDNGFAVAFATEVATR